jgi:hypothetical protein
MLDFQLLVTTARYQKTREARLAQEPINFNVYNVELPYGIVAHYPYGTQIADVRAFHELPKETAVKAPTTCSKLNEVQVSTHLNFQPVPMLSQGANIATLPQIVGLLESFFNALSDIWRLWNLQAAKALKQGDTAIIFIGDEPQACEVLTATKGIDKTVCRILVVDSPTWVKTTELYTLSK